MKITYLGSGNAFVPQRDWGCLLINDAVLLDAGPSLLLNLKRLNLDPAGIRHIFISHFHGDHFFGIPFLLLEYCFLSPTREPLAIIGPPGVENMIENVMRLAYPDVMHQGWPRPMIFVDVEDGRRHTVEGLPFTAIKLDHVADALDAFGYRIEFPEGMLAYSGDTRLTDAVYSLVEDARIIILEASSQNESPVHLGLNDLRKVLQRVPKDSLVFLNHLDTSGPEPWQEFHAIVPNDLQSFRIDFSAQHPLEVLDV